MKKTCTVNLYNSVFHIDEDAYEMLQEYMIRLRSHFAAEESADEILRDIEARIAELCNERIRFGMQIITIQEITEIISIMGHPEDFDSDITPYAEANAAGHTDHPSEENPESGTGNRSEEIPPKPKKRIFRDTGNRVLGGVASGIGRYLDIDPVFIRILLVILTIFWGSSIWAYIVLWICIPEARTAAQKLEMNGEPVTVENIQKTVKEESEQPGGVSPSPNAGTSLASRLGRVLLQIIKAVFLLFGGCLGILLFLILLSAGISLLPFLMENFSLLPVTGNSFLMNMLTGSSHPYWLLFLLTITIGIPCGALLRLLLKNRFNWKPLSSNMIMLITSVWIIAFIALAILSVEMIPLLL